MAHAEPMSPASAVYREPVCFALLQQIPTATLCLLVLDGGSMARVCGSAVAGFWVGTAWLVARRPSRPSRTDLLFIRWGFFPLLIASFILAVVWSRWSAASQGTVFPGEP